MSQGFIWVWVSVPWGNDGSLHIVVAKNIHHGSYDVPGMTMVVWKRKAYSGHPSCCGHCNCAVSQSPVVAGPQHCPCGGNLKCEHQDIQMWFEGEHKQFGAVEVHYALED